MIVLSFLPELLNNFCIFFVNLGAAIKFIIIVLKQFCQELGKCKLFGCILQALLLKDVLFFGPAEFFLDGNGFGRVEWLQDALFIIFRLFVLLKWLHEFISGLAVLDVLFFEISGCFGFGFPMGLLKKVFLQ